jgi:hypothetical protein
MVTIERWSIGAGSRTAILRNGSQFVRYDDTHKYVRYSEQRSDCALDAGKELLEFCVALEITRRYIRSRIRIRYLTGIPGYSLSLQYSYNYDQQSVRTSSDGRRRLTAMYRIRKRFQQAVNIAFELDGVA